MLLSFLKQPPYKFLSKSAQLLQDPDTKYTSQCFVVKLHYLIFASLETIFFKLSPLKKDTSDIAAELILAHIYLPAAGPPLHFIMNIFVWIYTLFLKLPDFSKKKSQANMFH